ncbi:MAG: cupredoxin domain-containing protein [Nitrospira sp.]|nr:cupredoxin domain-containing protein [Nitrospira sp.]
MNRVCIVAIALTIGAGAGVPALNLSTTTQILMENGSPYYVPATATVASGTPIRWDNPTPTHHTVTHNDCVKDESPCLFDSGTVSPGGHFTVPSLPAGRYPYHCGIHPIMRGQLVVTDGLSTPSQL